MPDSTVPVPLAAIHIALLDDHAMFRQAICSILQALPYVEAVTETADLAELLVTCRQRLPDLLLLDLEMPQLNGIEAAQQLWQEFPTLKVIVLSMHAADKYVTQMMRLGARSYLPKEARAEQLMEAVADVLQTGYHYTPHISRALVRGAQQPGRQLTASLANSLSGQLHFTPREQEVLQFICQGFSAAAIAKRLFISRRTVEGHWQRLLEKTGAGNVAGLVLFATKNGLLNP